MPSNMAAPYKTLFNFWKYWNFWITATSSKLWLESLKLGTWLTWPSSIHFWSQKSGICYLRGFCGHVTSHENHQHWFDHFISWRRDDTRGLIPSQCQSTIQEPMRTLTIRVPSHATNPAELEPAPRARHVVTATCVAIETETRQQRSHPVILCFVE